MPDAALAASPVFAMDLWLAPNRKVPGITSEAGPSGRNLTALKMPYASLWPRPHAPTCIYPSGFCGFQSSTSCRWPVMATRVSSSSTDV
ncbi:hypothetical protein (plasmid) [Erwinia amylovora ATCC 49946]|nr:hypothetical protein [Erwinia amylovora ATCC 49946]